YGTLSTFLLYFTGRKVVSRSYGVIAALILATSLEFTILAKFAILDIVVSTCIGFAVMFGFLTFFVEEKSPPAHPLARGAKMYYWWLFYIFSGLAVMAKGIPGFVIPFGTMFFASIAAKRFKEIFRPQYILPGALLFLLIVLPWHIAMFKMYDPLFFDEYIIKHHLARFAGAEVINRSEPFYFYILTFLWGFAPWILFTPATLFSLALRERVGVRGRFFILNAIGFVFTFLFFSVSSTKLITYILPVYFFSANIMAFVWSSYIKNGEYKKFINPAVYIFGAICLIAAVGAAFCKLYLPEQLYADISPAVLPCIALLVILGAGSITGALKNKRILVFASYVFFFTMMSAFLTKTCFQIDYKFGQNDLMRFAKIAKENNKPLAVYDFGRRYSLIYYYDGIVDFDWKDKSPAYVVAKNKNLPEGLKTIEKGRKYTLLWKP
ncbi:MAG: hypothetical protein LBJ74_03950, partial [Heliobacteriaceae bacterium]|nr:hypothetical protein [Heliobacteriaceae bacterium]